MTAVRHASAARRGFSLPEILMAVFILAVGVISIAALLPAGIAQQQRSVDDVLGPVVAEHALGVVRSKVRPEDFGILEEFTGTTWPDGSAWSSFFGWGGGRPDGDWGWLRPSFIPAGTDARFPRGAIDLFNAASIYDGTLSRSEFVYGNEVGRVVDDMGVGFRPGLPYDRFRYGSSPPEIFITREERSWPTFAATDATATVIGIEQLQGRDLPQYHWECMFQRQGGVVRVAILVYRVLREQGTSGPYTTARGLDGDGNFTDWPPLPYRLDLTLGSAPAPPFDATVRQAAEGPVDALAPAPPAIAAPAGTFSNRVNPFDADEAWTIADQWLVDQNGSVHRVLFGRDASGAVDPADEEVVFAGPIPELFAGSSEYFAPTADPADWDLLPDPNRFGNQGNGQVDQGVVSEIWYLPLRDGDGRRIVPVYCMVREL